MKTYNGNLWQETNKDGIVSIGLSPMFLNEALQECFHILPADFQDLKAGGPMLVVETNDGLESLTSPVTGRILSFNDKARNFPDRLTEEDVIVRVLPEGIKAVEVKKTVKKKVPAPVFYDFDELVAQNPAEPF